MNKVKISRTTALIVLLSTGGLTQADELQSLKNMERERAQMVSAFIDTDATPHERQQTVSSSKRHLVDLERMVLRDDELLGNTSRLVKLVFRNYDLSFLVHASAEAEHGFVEHWLTEVGLSNDAILGARIGPR
jgi:hypothetical protein